ncbi:Gfo/Idh/MocA family protein [Bacillus kwashiorkori]|uniref:Gfo/Idh/MocA family protein n=1 Tax=Bacillus kwashiorkori TaxID=1522318 RepID=UPI00078204FD|nr:Gfo/Idh/MocA family oxidoreductase [Bacillus kwashiorkori]
MLKVGVIGLGDIAQKAYLPVYNGMKDVEFHFYTRNQHKLRLLGKQFRYEKLYASLESLMESGIAAAFVHSSTDSHEEIVGKLLEHNIHVFVDKPITDNYESTKRLVKMANEKDLILMTGFNRRYAPTIMRLKEMDRPNLILVQKNRHNQPGKPRTFVYDDFIHVVDTMRYLFPYPIEDIVVNGRKMKDELYHLVVQFISPEATAIGIMNRDNGSREEIAEVMGPYEKRTVYNVSDLVISKGGETVKIHKNDWEPTLLTRGFVNMVVDFIHAVHVHSTPKITANDALVTHKICEEIMGKLEKL